MKRKIATIIFTIIIAMLITVVILPTISLSSKAVSFTVTPDPLIDIALVQAKTNTNLTNFKADLLKRLGEIGVNKNKVNITQTISTNFSSNAPEAEKIFNEWKRVGQVGQWSYNAEEKVIVNAENTGNMTGFYSPDSFKHSYIDLNFDFFTANGDDDFVGAMVRFNDNGDGTVTSYIFIFDNTSTGWDIHPRGLYKLINNKFNLYELQECQTMTDVYWTRNEWQNIRILAEDNNIKVYFKNNLVIDYTDNSNTQIKTGSYGFLSCSQADSRFKEIQGQTMSTTNFEEIIRESTWRENSIKAIVNVQDGYNQQLTEEATLGELLSRTIGDEIHFVGWGTNLNQTPIERFIQSNNGNGIFVNNTNYTNSINQTAAYIKSLIDKIEQKNQYLILGEDTILNLNPKEYATNTADSNYPYGKWKIDHDFEYYENHVGQFANSGSYINNFIEKFDKTGKYTITFEDNSITPNEVYVHRRPVAVLKTTKNGNNITVQSESYDLDNYSQGNRGIAEEVWKYKRTTDTNWTTGKLTSISGNADYIIQLQVKDYQGVWSHPVSKYVTNRQDAKPVAIFDIKNREITKYEALELIDTSYDPKGGGIANRSWEVYRGTTRIYIGANPPTTYTTTGDYTVRLTVTNTQGIVSETYSKTFKIIDDTIAPEVTITPSESEWTQSVTVHLEFTDKGGSNFKSFQYAIVSSQATPGTWQNGGTQANTDITINQTGIWYLHVKATDNAGNTSSDRVTGPYHVDVTAPRGTVAQMPTSSVNDGVTISWNFTEGQNESGIKEIVLPNAEKVSVASGIYRVEQNGIYTFVAYDRAGNEAVITQEVTNIDKTGISFEIWKETIDDAHSKIGWEVTAGQDDFKNIVLPNGTYTTQKSGYLDAKEPGTYTFIAYDNAGNETRRMITIK